MKVRINRSQDKDRLQFYHTLFYTGKEAWLHPTIFLITKSCHFFAYSKLLKLREETTLKFK